RQPVIIRARVGQSGRPAGYGILSSGHKAEKSGSLFEVKANVDDPAQLGPLLQASEERIASDVWFTQEIVADGNRIIVKINDRVVVDYRDREARFTRGAIVLLPIA